jgi:hypothetical protein
MGESGCLWAHRSALDTISTSLNPRHALTLSSLPFLPFARMTEPANLPAWNATVWLTPIGRNAVGDCDLRVELAAPLEPPEPAAAAWLAVPVSPVEGAGGAPAVTALMTPARIVSARLGCGGGAEDDAAALVAVAADAPDPAETVDVAAASEPALAPAAKPVAPDTATPNAAAPARTREYAVDPTSPEIKRFATNGISPRASA